MKVVRDRAAATRLPSRHRFALARLIALLRFRPDVPTPAGIDHLMLTIDRDQSAVEIYAVSFWVIGTAVVYLAAILPLPAGWAILVSILATGLLMQVPVYVIGGVLVPLWNAVTGANIENNQKVQSVAFMTLMVIASSYFGVAPPPVRWVAWLFFTVLALNAAAWVILTALGRRVQEVERRCGL
jgi:hypothetical protein